VHLLDRAPRDFGKIQRLSAQNYNGLRAIRPLREGTNCFKSIPTDYESVNAGEELAIAVRFASIGWEEVERAIETGDESIDAGADED